VARIAAGLRRDVGGQPEDWSELTDEAEAASGAGNQVQFQLLGTIVNLWLKEGDARPQVIYEGDREFRFEVWAPEVYGAVGRQLATLIAGVKAFAFCYGCRKFIDYADDEYKRGPKRGQRTWCTECRKGIQAAENNRRSRGRAREKQKV
jgi:hypothetical protein